jgi:CDP-diacylglycerol--glycerol-3-phosphate 3-phosphatidyltransferase
VADVNAHIERLQEGYTAGTRRAVSRLVARASRLPVTANQVTAAGFLLSVGAAVLIYQEWWLAAGAVFIVASILDVFDGAIARSRGQAGPRGSFIDSTVDRVSEAVVLGAIAIVFARQGETVGLAAVVVALTASFLTSYVRAKAESLGLNGTHGALARAERVVLLSAGLILAPFGALPYVIALLAVLTALTVLQRVRFVLRQLP